MRKLSHILKSNGKLLSILSRLLFNEFDEPLLKKLIILVDGIVNEKDRQENNLWGEIKKGGAVV